MYLLDTHILIWALLDPKQLSHQHRTLLQGSSVRKFISIVSVWEISLKFGLGELGLGGHTLEEFLDAAINLGFHVVSPDTKVYASFHQLKLANTHKDPFDRMLIWQAIQDELTLLSYDNKISQYKLQGLKLA
jgi:PIN domain nuclease of toxin-antitoxin system